MLKIKQWKVREQFTFAISPESINFMFVNRIEDGIEFGYKDVVFFEDKSGLSTRGFVKCFHKNNIHVSIKLDDKTLPVSMRYKKVEINDLRYTGLWERDCLK